MVKKALVTGSAGFIGRHMVRGLRSRGFWPVVTYDLDRTNRRFMAYHNGDVLKLFRECDEVFDLVVHCAYHVGGRAAIDGTNTNFAKNLQLDSSLFEWAIRTKQRRVLYFSSSAAYPAHMQSRDWVEEQLGPIFAHSREEMRLREDWFETPQFPLEASAADANYGFAKCVGERLAEDARKNGLAVSVVRPFSGYGEDQSEDYPFPSIVKRARSGDLTVWGPPGQTRDWIHVSDVIAGALAVVKSETTDPVNLCTGVATEMGELAIKICQWAQGREPGTKLAPVYLEDKPTGVFYRVGDPTRFHQYYTPKISLEEGIRRALDA